MRVVGRCMCWMGVLALGGGFQNARAQGLTGGVSVITEMTAAGRSGPQPAPGRPVYFFAHDGGETDVGVPIGGQEEPDRQILASALAAGLRMSGYRPADEGHRASLFLFFRWGVFNRELPGFPPNERTNLVERAALVGGNAFAQKVLDAMNANTLDIFEDSGSKTVLLMQNTTSDLYYLVVSAYDYDAAQQGRRVLLWRTKASTISRGQTLAGTLPMLARSAGPYFGRDMSEAAWVEPRHAGGGVYLGQPTVVGEFSAPLPDGFQPSRNDVETFPKDRIGLKPF